MEKHRGFPGRLRGSDHQFVIRHENRKAGATKIKVLERFADRKAEDRAADEAFLGALIAHFGDEPFVRGNLDAGRISWLFMREVLPAEDPFDPESYDAMLRVDMERAQRSFPDLFE